MVKSSGGDKKGPAGGRKKHFHPSKHDNKIEKWIPEAAALKPKKPEKLDRAGSKGKAGSKKDMLCLQCRKTGHHMSKCPLNKGKKVSNVLTCYKCGETGHSIGNCTKTGSELSFATCFVCGKTGHISRECPDSKHGIYVSGGCCKLCNGVDHLYKDCPNLANKGRREWKPLAGNRPDPSEKPTKTTFGGDDLDDDYQEEKDDKIGDYGEPEAQDAAPAKSSDTSKSGKAKTPKKAVVF